MSIGTQQRASGKAHLDIMYQNWIVCRLSGSDLYQAFSVSAEVASAIANQQPAAPYHTDKKQADTAAPQREKVAKGRRNEAARRQPLRIYPQSSLISFFL